MHGKRTRHRQTWHTETCASSPENQDENADLKVVNPVRTYVKKKKTARSLPDFLDEVKPNSG